MNKSLIQFIVNLLIVFSLIFSSENNLAWILYALFAEWLVLVAISLHKVYYVNANRHSFLSADDHARVFWAAVGLVNLFSLYAFMILSAQFAPFNIGYLTYLLPISIYLRQYWTYKKYFIKEGKWQDITTGSLIKTFYLNMFPFCLLGVYTMLSEMTTLPILNIELLYFLIFIYLLKLLIELLEINTTSKPGPVIMNSKLH
ncbi:MAG: hypothetical protein ACI92I_000116 [Acidimicrobiales bacterium]|jgi:hypothetical protein